MDKIFEKNIKSLPASSGVYLIKNKNGKVIYVGKGVNLGQRARAYLEANLELKVKAMVSQAASLDHIKVFSEFEALLLEATLIKKHQPKYNQRLKDDKSFLYIGVTEEEFPRVLAARKNDLLKVRYLFGPFPSAKTVRQVLRFLRKVFPYCSQKGEARPCFWSHLGLCLPCPGEIVKLEGWERKAKKRIYLENIKNLSSLFQGQHKNLIKKLTSQMTNAAEGQDFETAAKIRNQIEKLSWLTGTHFPISAYLEKPSFVEEEQEKERESLSLKLSPFFANLSNLWRIEAYDVSNILGQAATGSMVVFLAGAQESDDYRRFKIKISGRVNDVAMLAEVLKRRFKHQEWDYPNLILVDGGKGQVSGAIGVLRSLNLKIPVIGLAKRMETLVIPKVKNYDLKEKIEFVEITLEGSSAALNLVKRIRDEAHRFALAYHRKLRKLSLSL